VRFWVTIESLLYLGAHVFWRLACLLMDVSLWFQRLDLKVYERIDPVGVKERRRQVLLMQQDNDERRDAW